MAFYSKSLFPVEQNYKIHDKKILAIIYTLEEWRYFLEEVAHLVEIWTDHKNLEYFMTTKKFNYHQPCTSKVPIYYLYIYYMICVLLSCTHYVTLSCDVTWYVM